MTKIDVGPLHARPGHLTGRSRLAGTPTRLLVAGLLAFLPACGGDSGTDPVPSVASLTVSASSSTTLEAFDETLQLVATALDAGGNVVTDVTINWSSGTPGVAGVDASGLVTALGNGSATITASAGGASGTIGVTVEQVTAEMAFSTAPTNNSVGVTFDDLVVEARDANGNVALNFTEQVAISIGNNPMGGTLTGQFGRDAVEGVATFPGLALDAAGAGYTLVATAGALSVESGPFNVTLRSIYVGHQGGSSVTVLDPETNTVLTTFTAGTAPIGVVITPDGLHAYVANLSAGTVSVIETPGHSAVETITVGTEPLTLAMSPDGSTVYVANSGSDNVSVVDTETNTVTETVTVGEVPAGISVTPDGAFVYVVNFVDGTVSVIETATNTVTTTITVGTSPIGVTVTPGGGFAYVTNGGSDNVSVINTGTNAVVATIPVGDTPYFARVTPDGSAVLVANLGGSTVSRIETESNTVSETITAGTNPVDFGITFDGQHAYVSNFSSSDVSVIDLDTNTVVETITVNANPWGVAVMPDPIP